MTTHCQRIALGTPIGSSGARILATLLYEMIPRDVHKGIAALCPGGANAVGHAVVRSGHEYFELGTAELLECG